MRKRSAVWKFFVPTTANKARCLVCEKIVSRTGLCTSNLRKHIQTHHPSEYADLAAMDAAKRDGKDCEGGTVAKVKRVVRINPLETTYSCVRTQKESSSEDEYSSKQPRNKRGHYEALRNFNNDDDSSQSNKGRKIENSGFTTTRSIKRESEDEESEGAGQQSETVEDLWQYFEKLPPNRAKCILCKEILSRDTITLTQHINEKHRKVALDLPSDSDDDQRDVYTEVVYLEDEQPIDSRTIRVKSTKNYQEVRPKKRRLSSRMFEDPKCRVQKVDSEPRKEVMSDADEEIENFGRYVIGLLKKLPKDVCSKLQMDIINMVMTAKLKASAKPEPVKVTVGSVQDGVVFTPVSVSSANVIVTTPSDCNYSGQNGDSMPSIAIVVENDKES